MKKGETMTKPTKKQLVGALKRILNANTLRGQRIAHGHARNLVEKAGAALLILVMLTAAAPAFADYGSGCPVNPFAGMKVFEDAQGQPIAHPGQWFTATYPAGGCGGVESDVMWTASPAALTDTCYGAGDFVATLEAGQKRCLRAHGKVFWIGTPGTYDVTATSPAGGTWTLEGVVVD